MDTDAPVLEEEDLFLMTNVHPKRSGLPFVVYISEKRGQHDVRVKVSSGPRATDFIASVSVRPEVRIVEGALSARDFDLVRRWIDLNRDVIIGFWERTIEDSVDAVLALKPLPKK